MFKLVSSDYNDKTAVNFTVLDDQDGSIETISASDVRKYLQQGVSIEGIQGHQSKSSTLFKKDRVCSLNYLRDTVSEQDDCCFALTAMKIIKRDGIYTARVSGYEVLGSYNEITGTFSPITNRFNVPLEEALAAKNCNRFTTDYFNVTLKDEDAGQNKTLKVRVFCTEDRATRAEVKGVQFPFRVDIAKGGLSFAQKIVFNHKEYILGELILSLITG